MLQIYKEGHFKDAEFTSKFLHVPNATTPEYLIPLALLPIEPDEVELRLNPVIVGNPGEGKGGGSQQAAVAAKEETEAEERADAEAAAAVRKMAETQAKLDEHVEAADKDPIANAEAQAREAFFKRLPFAADKAKEAEEKAREALVQEKRRQDEQLRAAEAERRRKEEELEEKIFLKREEEFAAAKQTRAKEAQQAAAAAKEEAAAQAKVDAEAAAAVKRQVEAKAKADAHAEAADKHSNGEEQAHDAFLKRAASKREKAEVTGADVAAGLSDKIKAANMVSTKHQVATTNLPGMPMSETDELDSSDITPADVQAAVAQFVAEEDASDDKFRGEQLVLGNPEESDLRNMIGLDDNRIFGKLLENTLKTMEVEWYTNGDEEDIANWEYVVNGIACSPEWVPEHVKESFSFGDYHGGSLAAADFDTGMYVCVMFFACTLPRSNACMYVHAFICVCVNASSVCIVHAFTLSLPRSLSQSLRA